jgi:hypothetical protein
MSNIKNSSNKEVDQGGNLLSSQEREAFKMISTGNDLHGQRALALLAIDKGATQAEAAQQSSLTPGQVKYWLGKFRRVRMEIFPEQVVNADSFFLAEEAPDKAVEKAAKPKKKKEGKKPKPKKAKKAKKDKGKGKGAKKKKKNTK